MQAIAELTPVKIEFLDCPNNGKLVFINNRMIGCRQDINGIGNFIPLSEGQLGWIENLMNWWFYNQNFQQNWKTHEAALSEHNLEIKFL